MDIVVVGRCDGCIGESNVIVVGSVVVVVVARCWCVMVLLVGSNRHWEQSLRS